jgi:hypothetical protein
MSSLARQPEIFCWVFSGRTPPSLMLAGQRAGGCVERLRDAGHTLPGDPAVLASAFNALLEGFCQVWIAGGGEPIGRPLGDQEAIDTLTRLLMHGLAGQRQDQRTPPASPDRPAVVPPARGDRPAGRRPPSAMPPASERIICAQKHTYTYRLGRHSYSALGSSSRVKAPAMWLLEVALVTTSLWLAASPVRRRAQFSLRR